MCTRCRPAALLEGGAAPMEGAPLAMAAAEVARQEEAGPEKAEGRSSTRSAAISTRPIQSIASARMFP